MNTKQILLGLTIGTFIFFSGCIKRTISSGTSPITSIINSIGKGIKNGFCGRKRTTSKTKIEAETKVESPKIDVTSTKE